MSQNYESRAESMTFVPKKSRCRISNNGFRFLL